MFDIAARERWARPGHSGQLEPPTLVFWGADGHGSLYLAGLPKDPRWVRGNDIGLIASAMEKTASECPGGVAQRDCFQLARNVIRPCRISNKRPSLPLLPGLTFWSSVRPGCTGHRSLDARRGC